MTGIRGGAAIGSALQSRRGDRAAVYAYGLLTGIVAGLVVSAYRLAALRLEEFRRCAFASPESWRWERLLLWAGFLVLAGLATAFMTRKAPLIKGSGIPQVKALLMRRLRFNCPLELPLKFAGGSLALAAGLSLGREGPSIQMGALVGSGLSRKDELRRYLVTAGSAAGISAAFNAPLAGVLFCLEELHRNFSPTMLGCSMTAAFAANAVSWFFFGSASVFNLEAAPLVPPGLYPYIVFAGIATGLCGAFFNAALLAAQKIMRRLFASERLRITLVFTIGGLVAVFFPDIAGGGHHLVERAARHSHALLPLAALAVGKFLFTILCYASGSPGGIFLPMLAIGALLGGLIEIVLDLFGLPPGYGVNFVILGMVGYFTAVVRAPITGALLITEMTGSFGHFPALILVALIASLVAGLVRSRPVYDSLLNLLLPDEKGVFRDDSGGEGAVLLYVPVMEGSRMETASDAQRIMPPGALLVGIQRGGQQMLPRPDMDIHPGDVAMILAPAQDASAMNELLLELGRPGPGHIERQEL